jgi:hypothetical protein
MKIPEKIQPVVNSICDAYRLKGEKIAIKRFNHIVKRDKLAYFEMEMLNGYVKHQLKLNNLI